MVVDSIHFCFARGTGCVYIVGMMLARWYKKEGRIRRSPLIRETENPKVSGYCAKSRLMRVDFPVPEGPETTIMGFLPISHQLRVVSALDT